jgi:hypothetical protein
VEAVISAEGISLLKQPCLAEDRDGKHRSLRYLRSREGREVDFLKAKEEGPVLMVEVKSQDRSGCALVE